MVTAGFACAALGYMIAYRLLRVAAVSGGDPTDHWVLSLVSGLLLVAAVILIGVGLVADAVAGQRFPW